MIVAFLFCGSATANNANVKTSLISSSTTTDIVVTYIKAPVNGFKGHFIILPNTIKNQGKTAAHGFYVEYYLKKDVNGTNIYLGQRYISSLAIRATNTQNTRLKIPLNINSGKYFVRAYVDSTNCINDINRSNNVRYSTSKIDILTVRPVYITSDNIKNHTADIARIDNIVRGLNSRGLYAVNYGLGPNKHYSVLKNINIPINALIVNIYGGACAGTIWEMTRGYYRNLVGNRTIFSIWINTGVNIGNMSFLKRSYDDKDTPQYGKSGGFPDFLDVNKNGIFEPEAGELDGIKNPGTLLLKYGYHYLYQKNGDINSLINEIFKQAVKNI